MTSPTPSFPALLQEFFQRLVTERGVSAHTIASYRDTFELLLGFAQQPTGRTPSALTLEDLDAPLVLTFLDHLEHARGRRGAARVASGHRDPNSMADVGRSQRVGRGGCAGDRGAGQRKTVAGLPLATIARRTTRPPPIGRGQRLALNRDAANNR
jgi:integrase family protein with SAM-like domain